MIRPYKCDDNKTFAVVSVDMDAACPGNASVSVTLVEGHDGAKKIASQKYAAIVNETTLPIWFTNFLDGNGHVKDNENGVAVVRIIPVNIAKETGEDNAI